jgi:ATP-dependent Lhr-like helicase
MIYKIKKRCTKKQILSQLNKYVAQWFDKKFKELAPPQKYGLKAIHQGRNVLISSPTGTGKTFTAFLIILSELYNLAEKNKLEDKVYCLYISPLKALSNDIYRNLEEPLKEINKIRKLEVRHAIRTGDTTQRERQKQLKKPPHILITTPESLAILLSTSKFKENLKDIKWIIVDEIHSLADNKRGVHLSLSLERLQNLAGEFQRIGLSATISPLEEVAKFLVGYNGNKERTCYIVDVRFVKKKSIKVISPVRSLLNVPTELTLKKMYEQIIEDIKKHKTTLIFTNTRSGTERVVYNLKKYLSENELIEAHHGSLSREIRKDVEKKLKEGKLKVIVSSTSLELGIDIGYIDLVIQLGSPKSIARCLQRIGRSGHSLEDTIKGKIYCFDRDDLVECAIIARNAIKNKIDKIRIPKNCLDVLAQHIMGLAIEKKWKVEDAFKLIKNSYCYHNLKLEDFISVLNYLAGKHQRFEKRKVYGKIWFDEKERVFGRRGKYARVIYSLNIGTIPSEVAVKVYTRDKKLVGTIEESFLDYLTRGDRFVLGGKVYEFLGARGLRALVKEAFHEQPTIPSWFSEQLPLSFDLALDISKFRIKMLKKIKPKIIEHLRKNYNLDGNAALAIYDYLRQEALYLKKLKIEYNTNDLLIESYKDEKGIKLIFHFLFGRRVNDVLSRAYAYLGGKENKCNVGIATTDNGFCLIFSKKSIKMNFIKKLNHKNLEEIVKRAIEKTELMKRHFRHCSTRALMILKNYKGHEIKVRKQQLSASSLLNIAKEIENFPIISETYREILEDKMDIENAKKILEKIENGELKFKFFSTSIPTPFAHNIVLLGLTDILMLEDRRKILEKFSKQIEKQIAS